MTYNTCLGKHGLKDSKVQTTKIKQDKLNCNKLEYYAHPKKLRRVKRYLQIMQLTKY